jgi:rSAM/selenodomain-associated transferase 1
MIDQISNGVLLVFAKTPIPGYVKTRLIPELGIMGAAELYKKMLHRTLGIARQSEFRTIELWCIPDASHPDIVDCIQKYLLDVKIQEGDDLGERMWFAFESVLEKYQYAVLIGCDCPELSAVDLNYARKMLESNYDAILGPVEDGGYHLIGLKKNNRQIFTGIEWGQANVADITRSKMKNLGWTWDELPTKRDVDTIGDIRRLQTASGAS